MWNYFTEYGKISLTISLNETLLLLRGEKQKVNNNLFAQTLRITGTNGNWERLCTLYYIIIAIPFIEMRWASQLLTKSVNEYIYIIC